MNFRLSDRARSFRHAFQGIEILISTQHNAWIHLVVSIGVVGLGLWMAVSPVEWAILVVAMMLVWVAEAVNTAIEFLADEVTLERREGIGRTKDVAAGAVLLASMGAVVLGLLVFVPHFLK